VPTSRVKLLLAVGNHVCLLIWPLGISRFLPHLLTFGFLRPKNKTDTRLILPTTGAPIAKG